MQSFQEELIIIYTAILYIAGVCNLIYALALTLRAFRKQYHPYPTYRRAMVASALAMLTFGLPYFIHAYYSVRLMFPLVATVIGLTSFHIGALLFAYTYIELISPQSLTRQRKALNIAMAAAGVATYWGEAISIVEPILFSDSELDGWPDIPLWTYTPFFIHALYLASRTYQLYIKARKADPATTEKTLRPFLESLPKSVHLIVTCGIGSIILYCIFPEGILTYTILMFVAYFAFYYIYRALSNYSNSLIEQDSHRNSKTKWHHMLISYNAVYHFLLLFLLLGAFYIFADKPQRPATSDTAYPYLNLTKHAYWDNPDFDDHQMTGFLAFLYTNMQNQYFSKILELYDDSTTYQRSKQLTDEINALPENYYKGLAQVMAAEVSFSRMPKELLTADNIHDYIARIYNIAQGSSPISQQAFFSCWENAMVCYADIDAIDSVKAEADRLLTICRKQNMPYGGIVAYSALSYCLEKIDDYKGASVNLEIAIDNSDRLFTEKYGKDWQNMDKDASDLLFNHYFMMAKNARYHLECADTTWFRQHIHELEAIERNTRSSSNLPIERNLYYTLATYHDKWGNPSKYHTYRQLFQNSITDLLEKQAFDKQAFGKQSEKELYYTMLVRHALRNHQPEEAMNYINLLPDYFRNYRKPYYPDALLQLGRYQEAAEWYRQSINHRASLNANLSVIATMTTGVQEENHQMQIIQAQMRNQHTRLMYNSLLIFVLAIMIGGLAYFIYRQHRLNKELSAAISAEERAKHVRDIFLKNMTHEFHTPLNAVYGFAQILADRSFPLDEETTREMANEMMKSSEHITRLLDDIVNVTDKISKLDRLEDVESIIKDQQQHAEEAPFSC